MKKQLYTAILCLFLLQIASAQQPEQKTKINPSRAVMSTTERARSVIDQLNIQDNTKKAQAYTILLQHLDSQQVVFKTRKKAMDDANMGSDKELADGRAEKAWAAATGKFNKLGATFLGKMSTLLTMEQNDMLKDALTEDGLKREYDNYLDLFPNLSSLQKSQVFAYLMEARENAMNGDTPENRVDWFIKYRGRANNYLAAAGYDLRKATDAQKIRRGNK